MSDTIQCVKTLDVRLIHTHGTEAEWATKTSFVPEKGELIVYDADEIHTYARYKIGDGVTTLINLPFLNKLTPGRGIEITDDHTITFAHPEILDAASMVGISSVGNTTTHNIATKSDFNTFKEEIEETITNLEDKYALKEEISQPMINITYFDLLSLRDSADLVPGQLYRITNYKCTTTQEDTSSAGHKFDIIVRADSESLLNENAWATYHYNEDGAVDGYFKEKIKILEEATLKEGVVLEDMIIIGKSMEDSAAEIDYGGAGDTWSWKEDDYLTTWISPKYGFEVPAIFDPDPDQTGSDCVYIYEDTLNMPIDNSLVKLRYALSDIETEDIYHDEDSIKDYYNDVIVDFKYDEDDCPVIYKTQSFAYITTDYEDKFVYEGEYEFNGDTYSMWIKRDSEGDSNGLVWLTDSIVNNGRFIYSIDELKAAVVYRVVDKWVEYLQGTIFNQCARFTDNVVNATWYSQIKQNANLAAWELKYSLDNDENRFYWADIENGRGVIYYMKDEYNNECPYDFKNILFNDCYTFNWHTNVPLDLSILGNNGSLVDDDGSVRGVYNNIIKPYYEPDGRNSQRLNNIVFDEDSGWDSGWFYGCYDNQFNYNCHDIYFENHCTNNIFGIGCYSNTFADSCYSNTLGNYCYSNTFGSTCNNNIFGNRCRSNVFDNECFRNTFGDYYANNTFGANCSDNTFGNYCYDNTFEDFCCYNTFGVNCYGNTFRTRCFYIEVKHSRFIDLYSQSTNAIIEHVKGGVNNLKKIQFNSQSDLTIVRPSKIEEILI